MDPLDKSLTLFSTMYVTAIVVLVISGDRRPDVYLSVSILIYFLYVSLDENLRKSSKLTLINIALLVVFVATVTYRVAQLVGWIP